ncbi:MAG: ABC transporter permease [Actinobacteria bacterium]|nr:ABC transporter permease [Actinomycetota bacterium]
MRLALQEMRRRPGRFVTATAILTLIALLLLFLGGLLDGLIGSATSAISGQTGDVITFSSTSQSSLPSSRVGGAVRSEIAGVPGVERVGGLGVTQVGARVPGRSERDLVDVALFGYELPPAGLGVPPDRAKAYADTSLRAKGVAAGGTILLGPARTPITIAGFVDGLRYGGQGTLWASPETWRVVQAANRPDAASAVDVFQAFVVRGDGSVRAAELARRIDDATRGSTSSRTTAAAADAQPGVEQQRSTFNQIIGATVGVAIVVVALFFALLIVERTALYGVLKAIGARSRTLFGGVVTQAIVVSLLASAIGALLALVAALTVPAGSIPFSLSPARVLGTVALLVLAAILGCSFSLRRVLRIDPASAIGTAS